MNSTHGDVAEASVVTIEEAFIEDCSMEIFSFKTSLLTTTELRLSYTVDRRMVTIEWKHDNSTNQHGEDAKKHEQGPFIKPLGQRTNCAEDNDPQTTCSHGYESHVFYRSLWFPAPLIHGQS